MKIWDKIKELFTNNKTKSISSKFIIEAFPKHHEVSELEAVRAQTKLEERKQMGIPEKDINIILKYIINNTRISLKNNLHTDSLEMESMMLQCGFAQAIAAYQLEALGIDINIENVGDWKYSNDRHAILVANFLANVEGEVQTKRYLVDTTYRQFFQTQYANYERFFLEDDIEPKIEQAPSAGYFVCKTEEGREFSTKLIEDGYIELTPENAKIYGDGFYLSSRGRSQYKNQKPPRKEIKTSISKDEYFEEMINIRGELDYTKEELEGYGDTYKTPKEKMNEVEENILKDELVHNDTRKREEQIMELE